MRSHPLMALLVALLVLGASRAQAADFYVDPAAGSASGDGSAAKPWKSLQAVIDAGKIETRNWASLPYSASAKLVTKNAGAPVKAGDTIYLLHGYHGELAISGHYNASFITIEAAPGASPTLGSVVIRSSAGWHLKRLQVSQEGAPKYTKQTLVVVHSHDWHGPANDIIVERCTILSVADTTLWTAADWNAKACDGIEASGKRITLRRNTLRNVNFGITVTATDALVESNVVDGFAGDGMRGLGDRGVFQYNTIKNCYDVNQNHDDGFQSWSVGADGKVGTGQVTGVVLRGNRIINYENPKQKYRCALQGIGMFDGTFVDWVIENNVIVTDHHHGITLLGARGCRVVNNTVLDPNDVKPGPAWIRVAQHKNGTPASGCVVRNNLAPAINCDTVGVTVDHNLTYSDPKLHFVNPATDNLRLKASSPAIDKGAAALAPKLDADGVTRPQGAAVDVGAYEWRKVGADVVATDVGLSDMGARDGPTGSKGDPGATPDSDGCTCQTASPGLQAWALALLLLVWRRRRCRLSGI